MSIRRFDAVLVDRPTQGQLLSAFRALSDGDEGGTVPERGRTIGERRLRLLRGLAILVAGVAIVAGAAGT